MQCCLLNGGLSLLSIIFFNTLLLPLLQVIVTSFTDPNTWNYIELTLSWIFSFIWVIPLFILAKIFNFFWFQDIADGAYIFRRGNPTVIPSISLLLADVVFSIIVQSLFIFQVIIISLSQSLNSFLNFAIFSILFESNRECFLDMYHTWVKFCALSIFVFFIVYIPSNINGSIKAMNFIDD